MIRKQALLVLGVGFASLLNGHGLAEERIWLKAKINGKPVRMCFDSGANGSALTPRALQKLGLKFIQAPTNDLSPGLLAGDTEECNLSLAGREGRMSFLVLNLPIYAGADFDGLIAWPTLSQNLLRIDAIAGEVKLISKVPKQSTEWIQLSIITNYGTLDLKVLHANQTHGVISVDTGSENGIALPSREWHRWKAAHPASPITLATSYTPTDDFMVREEAWADRISIGPVQLTDVPIEEAAPSSAARWGPAHEGTLGLAALKRLDLVVNGAGGLAYLRAKVTKSPPYSHNRLGAVFMPTSTQTNRAVALVVKGGPAYGAGVRDGDVLLQVDEIRVTGWTADWQTRFHLPPDTKLSLTLERDGETFKTTATLREILKPSRARGKESKPREAEPGAAPNAAPPHR